MLTCAHTAWKSTSASLIFCTSAKERVENLKISRGQLAPYQEKRIKRQQTVSSARCKVLAPSPGFLLAPMPSYCRFKPIECSYSESVSGSVPQDKIRGSAILSNPVDHAFPLTLLNPVGRAPALLLLPITVTHLFVGQKEGTAYLLHHSFPFCFTFVGDGMVWSPPR